MDLKKRKKISRMCVGVSCFCFSVCQWRGKIQHSHGLRLEALLNIVGMRPNVPARVSPIVKAAFCIVGGGVELTSVEQSFQVSGAVCVESRSLLAQWRGNAKLLTTSTEDWSVRSFSGREPGACYQVVRLIQLTCTRWWQPARRIDLTLVILCFMGHLPVPSKSPSQK